MSSGHGHGSHGRSRKKHEDHEEHENHERWAVSYADMMTVLVGLFIVLFAMSQIDTIKFEQLRRSLAIGFGQQAPSMMAGGAGVLSGLDTYEISPDFTASVVDAQIQDPPTPDTDLSQEQKNYDLAVTEYERLADIVDKISGALDQENLSDRVTFRVSDRGLIIGMVADDVFFSPDSATLTPTAGVVIDTTGSVLATLKDQISVEGNANTLPSQRYETNWELAADRATKVARRLVERGYVPGNRIAAVSFGDQRPLADDGGDPYSANRRVDLVVLTPVSDEIRKYLPDIAAERG
ncbi:MAG: flagellar motor protein MotB [Actinomycetales bacterium]|nr:flagellar motor protein MotB [Actinomycetales bacterium]